MLVDMLSKSQDDVVQLFKRIGEKIDEFIVDENYKSIFFDFCRSDRYINTGRGRNRVQEKVGFFFKMRKKKEAEEAFISSRKRIIKCHCAKIPS